MLVQVSFFLKRGSICKTLIWHRNIYHLAFGGVLSACDLLCWPWLSFFETDVWKLPLGLETPSSVLLCATGEFEVISKCMGGFFSTEHAGWVYNPPNKHLNHFNTRLITRFYCTRMCKHDKKTHLVTGPENRVWQFYTGIRNDWIFIETSFCSGHTTIGSRTLITVKVFLVCCGQYLPRKDNW